MREDTFENLCNYLKQIPYWAFDFDRLKDAYRHIKFRKYMEEKRFEHLNKWLKENHPEIYDQYYDPFNKKKGAYDFDDQWIKIEADYNFEFIGCNENGVNPDKTPPNLEDILGDNN